MDLVWKAKAAAYAELREKEREKREWEVEIRIENEQGRKMNYLTRARTRKLERHWKREKERWESEEGKGLRKMFSCENENWRGTTASQNAAGRFVMITPSTFVMFVL